MRYPDPMTSRGRIEFDSYVLDPLTGELWHRGKRVKLQPKPAKVLTLLASSPGELILRETLRSTLWGDDTFVDFEHGLNFCIRKIRSVLKDDARKPRFIETLPKRGYRFIAGATPSASAALSPCTEATQISANEHYAKARAALSRHERTSLEEAYTGFQRALELQPDYAMAHSGMGATVALRILNRRDPGELKTALFHLRRAVELDGELSEPYPWLCFVHMRCGETANARIAGHRAVELQPDLPQAHYFLALAYLTTCEEGNSCYQQIVDHLANAARVGPHWHATWFVLAYSAMLLGDYRRATEFSHRLLETYRRPGMPFVGAEIVLSSVKYRQGDPAGARQVIAEFLERMAVSDHMYRDAMIAVATCVSGDIEMREGFHHAALAAYRRAWQTTQEHTRLVAHKRISARARAGLASAYWALGQHERAQDLLQKATKMTLESAPVTHAAAAASLPELYLGLAASYHSMEQPEKAMEMLRHSIHTGWRDAAWLRRDPMLQQLRTTPEFRECLAGMEALQDIQWAL